MAPVRTAKGQHAAASDPISRVALEQESARQASQDKLLTARLKNAEFITREVKWETREELIGSKTKKTVFSATITASLSTFVSRLFRLLGNLIFSPTAVSTSRTWPPWAAHERGEA